MENFQNGIHHISVLAGDAQRNADFYVTTLGMRLVKKTVNQDDPGTYHLFYANAKGSPGSSLTFFPWPMAIKGKAGVGEAVKVAFAVPVNSMEFWMTYLSKKGIEHSAVYERFTQQAISFKDPDGLMLELVFDEKAEEYPAWDQSQVPPHFGISGFKGTTLRLKNADPTAEVLKNIFHFEKREENENLLHFTSEADIGNSIIIEETKEDISSENGRGIIHHIAFRVKDKEDLIERRKQVKEMGLYPTEVIDRHWFDSVYFRSPGGVLFEMATDGPGYTVDEELEKLGEKLILPPWLEPRRKQIQEKLPEIVV